MNQLVSNAETFRAHVEAALHPHGKSMQDVSDDLSALFESILEQLAKEFPAPDKAPNHEERRSLVRETLRRLEEGTLSLSEKWGVPENTARELFLTIGPVVESLVVTTGMSFLHVPVRSLNTRFLPLHPGDLVEQHPTILEIMLFSGAILLIPESWILRPLLTGFGFGPNGPIKGRHLTGQRVEGTSSLFFSFRFIRCMGSKSFLRLYYST